jgi:predicted nucleic-acid-binding protein
MAKNNKGSLDTNTLLRLVLDDVPKQAAIVEALLKGGGIFEVSDITIIEMVFVLEKIYLLPRPLVADNINTIIRHSSISCSRKLFSLTLPLYIENPKLSIVDCTLAKSAELTKATPLYTFDVNLAKTCSPITQLL